MASTSTAPSSFHSGVQSQASKKSRELYRCVKLFEVEESTTVAGGETPQHAGGRTGPRMLCLYDVGWSCRSFIAGAGPRSDIYRAVLLEGDE